ncbi:T9SS C-terminal target domain-containing protein [Moheibacter sediminis]|uniref:Bulb-type lectin domain-containing protein n=1 Tax=Moheibacter sediminis TaxID=1434700 RepID=A0A1W2ARI6_9FLAO|nr:T9SS C-terminal target domain-containing protein [Moheibacter sediminis]SMC63130.1 hypothetical protein SAMN06296427_10519 [Moheibacter sediminis]
MKKILLMILMIIISLNLRAQVGIGTENPDPSAMLDVESTEKGFLPPRMTTVQRDAINSGSFTEGLVIYNTDIHCLQFWNATEWVSFCEGNTDPGGGDDDNYPPINYRLGGSDMDRAYSVIQTTDGGYIVVGESRSSASGDVSGTNKGFTDSWIVKLDASGDIEWDKLYGGNGSESAWSIQQTTDGGYIIGGNSSSSASGNVSGAGKGNDDYWILKLDASGNIVWDKLYGGSGTESFTSIRQTTDGGYIVTGSTNSSNSGDVNATNKGVRDAWIVKLDASGNIDWKKLYGGSGNESVNSVQQTPDGGYILAGVSQSSASGNVSDVNNGGQDYWILKLDASGNIAWDKLYGGSNREVAASIELTTDGGFIVAGISASSVSGDVSGVNNGGEDYWILKLDASGNKVWDKLYGGSNNESALDMKQTADGGYIIAGRSMSSASGDVSGVNNGAGATDYWIVKLDAFGNLIWEKLYGGIDADSANSIQQITGGGYIVVGDSAHTSAENGDQTGLISRGNYDYWILLLDENGNLIEP